MVGRKPFRLPEGVTVEIQGPAVRVVGPLGMLVVNLPSGISAESKDGEVTLKKGSSVSAAVFGLAFALVRNAVEGVSQGFTKELELVGVGYRVEKVADGLRLFLGFSHPIDYRIPEGVSVEVPENTKIKLSSIDKGLVAQTAANIRKLRLPEPYKGKGIRYAQEEVRRKQGKAVKVATGGGTT